MAGDSLHPGQVASVDRWRHPVVWLTLWGAFLGGTLLHVVAVLTLAFMENAALWPALLAGFAPQGFMFLLLHIAVGAVMGIGLGVVAVRGLRIERKGRELERQLLVSQRMESIGRLAGGIAHDSNNLLGALKMEIFMARSRLERCPARVQQHLEKAQRVVDKAAQLPKQLLAVARGEPGDPVVFDLDERIGGMKEIFYRTVGHEVELRMEPGSPGAVHMDPTQLEQVLLNLIVNARDAMPDGGRLEVRTRKEAMDGLGDQRTPHGVAVVEVSDTGTGMDASTLEKIFEPFYTTKDVGKGTGLGLATSKGIVERAGGRMSVRSAPGEGTVFTLRFPRSSVQDASADTASVLSPGRSGSVGLGDKNPDGPLSGQRVPGSGAYARTNGLPE